MYSVNKGLQRYKRRRMCHLGRLRISSLRRRTATSRSLEDLLSFIIVSSECSSCGFAFLRRLHSSVSTPVGNWSPLQASTLLISKFPLLLEGGCECSAIFPAVRDFQYSVETRLWSIFWITCQPAKRLSKSRTTNGEQQIKKRGLFAVLLLPIFTI